MERKKIIEIISNRIRDEQRKHPDLGWERIAAIKIVNTLEALKIISIP